VAQHRAGERGIPREAGKADPLDDGEGVFHPVAETSRQRVDEDAIGGEPEVREEEVHLLGHVDVDGGPGDHAVAVRQRRARDEPVILLLRVREEDRSAGRSRDGGKEPGVHLLVAASPHDHRCGRGGEHFPDDGRTEGHALPPPVGIAAGQG